MTRHLPAFFRRIALLLALGLSGLLLLVVLGLSLLLFTRHGGPWAFQAAERFSNGQVKADGVSGGFWGELTIQDLYVKTKTSDLHLHAVKLQWRPQALLQKRLHLTQLAAATVRLNVKPSPPTPFEPLPAHLPLDLLVDAAKVGAFSFQQQGMQQPLRLLALSAAALWDSQGLRLRHAAVVHPDYGALGASGLLLLEGDAIAFAPLAIAGPAKLQATGRLGLNGRATDLLVLGEALRWPLQGAAQITGSKLRLSLKGLPDDLAIDAQARLVTARSVLPAVPAQAVAKTHAAARKQAAPAAATAPAAPLGFALALQARLKQTMVEVAKLELLADNPKDGRVRGAGTLQWRPQLAADAKLTWGQLNPALLFPDYPGALNGEASIRGEQSGGGQSLILNAALGPSTLRGQRLSLEAQGRVEQRQGVMHVGLSHFKLHSGSAVLTGSGRVLPELDASAQFKADNLGDLIANTKGLVSVSVFASGSVQQPRLQLEANTSALAHADYGSVKTLKLKAQGSARSPGSAHLQATGIVAAGRRLDTLKLDLTGLLAKHQLTLDSSAPQGKIALALSGGYTAKTQQWQGSLQRLELDAAQAPPLRLTVAAPLLLSAKAQKLDRACLTANAARLCLDAAIAGGNAKLQFSLQQFALATLQPLLPKDVLLQAEVEGEGKLGFVGSSLRSADVQLRIGPGRLSLPQQQSLQLQSARLTLAPEGPAWAAAAEINADFGQAKASLRLPQAGADWQSRSLAGAVQLAIPSISFLQSLAPQLEGLVGALNGDLRLSGTLSAPRFAGEISLSNAAAAVPVAGLKLEAVSARVTGDDSGALKLSGSLSSGGGTLNLDGQARIDPAAEGAAVSAQVRAVGTDVQAVNLADYRVWVSPDLLLDYRPEGAKLTGSVTMPKAEITPRRLAAGAQAPSRDVVVVGRPAPLEPSLPIETEVRVVLGDAVRFEGFGLKARIEGDIVARDAPGLAATRARGELRIVEGRYKAYGQDLRLETGRLLFAGGPITDPTVDFRAVRDFGDDFFVAVLVRGSLGAPLFDVISSDASLSREDRIAWLVLGRPLSSTSSSERTAVNSAALSLGVSGGDFLLGRLGRLVGLDEVSVGAAAGEDVSAARITLGKYLSPKLYVSYGVGVFDAVNVFRLLYDLGYGFKLRTEAGLSAGGDILYTVEK
jgi:translocation and assembly module TamB